MSPVRLAALAAATGLGLVAGAFAVAGQAEAASAIGGPITRSEILARAQTLVDQGPTYTQDSCWNPVTKSVAGKPCTGEAYRRDCAGLVADAWHLPVRFYPKAGDNTNSPLTYDFEVMSSGNDPVHQWTAVPGGLDGLLPGDAIVRSGHMELFAFWKTPSRHTDGAYVYSFNEKGETVQNPYANSNFGNRGFDDWTDLKTYKPIRYNNIVEEDAGRSVSAVYNPAAPAMEVYYSSGGSLTEHYWDPAGWHGPVGLGAAISGSPAAASNPSNNALEVYFNSGGTLKEKYWTTGGGWSNPVTLAGGITGSPSAVYNPAADAMEVYYNLGGTLTESYWNATGWHGPINLGAAISGSPVAVANPANNALEVYFNSGGNLAEKYWTAAASWSNTVTLAGNVKGDPAAVYNAPAGALEVYYNAGSTLTESYWNSTGWHGPVNLGAAITGNPVAVANPMNNALEVYFNSSGTLAEKYWTAANSWSSTVTLAGGVTGTPSAVYNPKAGAMEVYYAANGRLTESYWNATGWNGPVNLGTPIS
jgi:hypothetical protein